MAEDAGHVEEVASLEYTANPSEAASQLPGPIDVEYEASILELLESDTEDALSDTKEGVKVRGDRDLATLLPNVVAQGWKFMSCSQCQESCQQASWLLIGYTRVNNKSEARSAS